MQMGHLTPWNQNQRAIRGFEWVIGRQYSLVGHKHIYNTHLTESKRQTQNKNVLPVKNTWFYFK